MRSIYLALINFFGLNIYAQSSVIAGNVTDMQGLPVMYASVFLEGTNLGAATEVSKLHFTPGHPRMFKANLGLSF